jgi:hypothetical protein
MKKEAIMASFFFLEERYGNEEESGSFVGGRC